MQIIDSRKNKVNARILESLKRWSALVYSAHVAALILGFVTATLAIVIGPAVQVLIRPDKDRLVWSDVIGPIWSNWFSAFLTADGLSVASLYTYLPLVLIVVATIKALLTIFQWYAWEWLGEQLAFEWRQKMVASFVNLSPSRRDLPEISSVEQELGGLMTQDIRTCRDYVVHFFGGLPREGLQAFFMAISVAALSPRLFLVFAFCLAPVVASLGSLGRKIRKRANRALEDNSALGEWIQQRLLGIETIKQYGTEDLEIKSMQLASANLYDGFLRATRVKARTGPMIEALGVLAISVAIGVAFFEITSGRISGAVAMSFFASLALFAQSATKLGRYFNSNREGMAAADRIFRAIDNFEAAKISQIRSPDMMEYSDRGALTLTDLSVSYGGSVAVDRVSYKFCAGKLYCVVGSSGAGKSSLLAAILGLREIASGTIKYELDKSKYRGLYLDISYMPQSVPTFPGSVAENVAYPDKVIDLTKVETSLHSVGFRLDNPRLQYGVKTTVGPGGLQFSGGEAQRLQLARLVYHKSPFVLIDEGTSALDPELETQVLKQAKELAHAGSVVIVVAHRPAAIEFADELIVMQNGRFARVGARAEVVGSAEFKKVFG